MLLVNFLCLFLQCRDTFMIEAFHNVILVYAPKRNHFGNEMFTCRLNLAVIDWVSNCFIQCTMPVNLFVYIQPPIHHSTHFLFILLLYLFVYLFIYMFHQNEMNFNTYTITKKLQMFIIFMIGRI